MKTFYAKSTCGCCSVGPMQFEDEAAAQAALKAAGLGSSMVIVDASGKEWDGIDTFYGCAPTDDEVTQRRLGYLAGKIIGSQDP